MIKFGPAGNSDLFAEQGYKTSLQAPLWLKNRDLDVYEVSFSRGFNMGEEYAVQLGEKAKECGIEITAHAPYYINFASTDEKLVEKSYNYILNVMKYLKLMQGRRCVFHVGSCGKLQRDVAFNLVKERIKNLVNLVKKAGYGDMLLCPETLGKSMQIGTYQEICEICQIDKMLVPTMDFGHINAITQGSLKNIQAFENVIKYLIENIGLEKTKIIHIHFSKIEYGPKGEIKHLTMEDKIYGPDFKNLVPVLKKYDIQPIVICESKGCQAEDANILKEIYKNTINL